MKTILCATGVALLAGCASFSPDGGFDKVGELIRERTGQTASWQRSPQDRDAATARVAELLARPLTADSAVEIALLNNRGLQASFFQLGVAESALVQAGRLANPVLGFGRIAGGGIAEIDRSILFDLLGLLTMPAATQVQRSRFEQAQYQAAFEAVGLAADARRAFYNAVAAQDLARYGEQVKESAEASSELARRMAAAGNFNRLAQMRQQAFHADATSQLARARRQAVSNRERLMRVLGLSGDAGGFTLPERLPDLPPELAEPVDAERTAMDRRLDLQMARRSADATARQLGLTRATGLVDLLEVGYANKSQTGQPRENGYDLRFELPIFDFGAARTRGAEAAYMQSVARAAEAVVNARSEVRESYAAYRTAYDLARHYRDEVVPLRKRMSDETLLRYNGMLSDVFELLADSREQVASVGGYVQSLRDFWIAQTDLQTAITGRSPRATPTESQP